MSRATRIGLYSLLILITLGAVSFGLYQLKPPTPETSTASPEKFSSTRAMEYLKNIAKAPHPIGSAEHTNVRSYIVSVIKKLGFNHEIQESSENNDGENRFLQNIVVRVAGNNSKHNAVMITAHYDSVSSAPGAGDDGAGVAALLETIRALKNTEQLNNDVIILFSDGEEAGMLGAKMFVKHRWFKDVKVVFNFEARGCSGHSIMYDSSKNNSILIREFIKASPFPVAFSSSSDYPKSGYNDLNIYKENEIQGLVFAFNKWYFAYHTSEDNLQNISQESIQHHGSYMLALAKHFGKIDLENLYIKNDGDVIFFNIFRSVVVAYPETWVLPIAIIAALVFLTVICFGLRKKLISITGITKGLLCFCISLLFIYILTSLVWKCFEIHWGEKLQSMLKHDAISQVYLLGFILITCGVFSLLYVWFAKECNALELITAALLVWVVMMIVTSCLYKGTSYMFTWPSIFSIIGLFILFKVRDKLIGFLVSYGLISIPTITLIAPSIYLFFIDSTLAQVNIYMVMLSLVLGLVIPTLYIQFSKLRTLPPVVLIIIGFILFLT